MRKLAYGSGRSQLSVKQRNGRFIVDTIWPDKVGTSTKMHDKETALRINKKIEVACGDEERIWRRQRQWHWHKSGTLGNMRVE